MARSAEKRIYRLKNRQHEESVIAEAQKSMDRNDMRWYYAIINGARHKTVKVTAMDNDWVGNLLSDKTMVAARWKKYFEDLLNGSSERAPRNKIFIMGDGQDVKQSTLDEVKKALKKLKNSKAA